MDHIYRGWTPFSPVGIYRAYNGRGNRDTYTLEKMGLHYYLIKLIFKF